jgi:hypothetical protein
MAGEIDLDLEFMLIAAKKHIPDKADHLAGVAQRLYHCLQELDVQSALAGDPAVLTNLLKAGGETYEALRIGVQSLNNAALAVNATAKDFVRTDADARADMKLIDVTLGGVGLADASVPSTPEPPVLEDPSEPGAGRPDDEPMTGHPTQGGTPSTPDPVTPGEDAEERDEQQEQSEQEHPYAPEEV